MVVIRCSRRGSQFLLQSSRTCPSSTFALFFLPAARLSVSKSTRQIHSTALSLSAANFKPASSSLPSYEPQTSTVSYFPASLPSSPTTASQPPLQNVASLPSELLSLSSDMVLALPAALGDISYASSLIILTLFLRSTITFPMTVWQRRRVQRVQQLVVPAAKEWMATARYRLRAEYRRAARSYDDYVTALRKETKVKLKQLSARYKCRTLPTLLVPPLIHLPVFIGTTLSIREACHKALSSTDLAASELLFGELSPQYVQLAAEQLLWCPSLADTDPFMGLPLLVGLTALLNVEIQAANRQRLAALGDKAAGTDEAEGSLPIPHEPTTRADARPGYAPDLLHARRKQLRPKPAIPTILQRNSLSTLRPVSTQGQIVSRDHETSARLGSAVSASSLSSSQIRSKAITNLLRFGSILFIPIAAVAPVAVNLYWLTSNLFSVAQSLYLGHRDRRDPKGV